MPALEQAIYQVGPNKSVSAQNKNIHPVTKLPHHFSIFVSQ
jgi:hypothetical protein